MRLISAAEYINALSASFAGVIVGDLDADALLDVRVYELFAMSFPDRAGGLNRTGFTREVVGKRTARTLWAAYF